jgi:hypothetical protein
MQLVASNSDKRQADWATKRVFFCTPEVGEGGGGGVDTCTGVVWVDVVGGHAGGKQLDKR